MDIKLYYIWIACMVGVALFLFYLLLTGPPNFDKKTTPDSIIAFGISKTASGYDIYRDNKLLYEFTKQNCDSLSLETLKMIYEGD